MLIMHVFRGVKALRKHNEFSIIQPPAHGADPDSPVLIHLSWLRSIIVGFGEGCSQYLSELRSRRQAASWRAT